MIIFKLFIIQYHTARLHKSNCIFACPLMMQEQCNYKSEYAILEYYKRCRATTDINFCHPGWGWWPRVSNDLFNIVREMTLVPRSAMSLQPENRNNGATLIVTLQAVAQRGTEGVWLKGEEGDDFVKRSLHTYLDFWSHPLSEQEKKVEEYEGKRTKNSPMWLETTSNIFSNAISEIRW